MLPKTQIRIATYLKVTLNTTKFSIWNYHELKYTHTNHAHRFIQEGAKRCFKFYEGGQAFPKTLKVPPSGWHETQWQCPSQDTQPVSDPQSGQPN